MITDLTRGRPLKVIWNFSLPLLLSTALQQLYNIADSVIVGRFTGSAGLAAIGAAYPITLFYIAFATGAAMGCSVIISQLFGAKRMGDLKSAVFTAPARSAQALSLDKTGKVPDNMYMESDQYAGAKCLFLKGRWINESCYRGRCGRGSNRGGPDPPAGRECADRGF